MKREQVMLKCGVIPITGRLKLEDLENYKKVALEDEQ